MRGSRFLLVCFVLACSIFAIAQTGSIQGTITDSSGAVVSGATITARNNATSATASATSSESGAYSIPRLAIGHYTITVEKTGFAPVKFTDVEVTVALTL